MSIHKKFFSNLNEIWYLGKMLQDGRPYHWIKGQGHRCLKVVKMVDFIVFLLRWYASNQETNEMMNYDTAGQYLNLDWTDFR